MPRETKPTGGKGYEYWRTGRSSLGAISGAEKFGARGLAGKLKRRGATYLKMAHEEGLTFEKKPPKNQ